MANAKSYFGKALEFNGVNQSVTNLSIAPTSEMTVSFVVDYSNTNARILGRADWHTFIQITSETMAIRFTGTTTYFDYTFKAGSIYNVNLVINSINATLYVDSVLAETQSVDFTFSNNITQIGKVQSYYGNSIVKDLYIFNRVLTQAEITKNYHEPEKFYNDAVADSACVLNMPMADSDGYVRDMDEYSEGSELNDGIWSTGTGWTDNGDGSFTNDGSARTPINKVVLPSSGYSVLEFTTTDNVQVYTFNPSFGPRGTFLAGTHKVVLENGDNRLYFYPQILGDTPTVSDISMKNITNGIYPIENHTIGMNKTQLSYGTQQCKYLVDDFGVRGDYAENFLSCDGKGYVDVPYSVNYTETKTIEYIIDKRSGDLTNFGNILYAEGGYALYSRFNENSDNSIGTNLNSFGYTVVSIENTSHICIVIEPTQYELYLNGVGQGVRDNSGGQYIGERLAIGSRVDGTSQHLKVVMRLFKIHNKAMTPQEVKYRYDHAVRAGLLN